MNYSGKINLLRFPNACIVSVKGRTQTKRGVFIPIDDNHVFVSADEEGKPRGAYIKFIAWDNERTSQYGDTHSLRQSIDREDRDRMTEEEQRAVPFFGNMKPFVPQNAASFVQTTTAEVAAQDDLPF